MPRVSWTRLRTTRRPSYRRMTTLCQFPTRRRSPKTCWSLRLKVPHWRRTCPKCVAAQTCPSTSRSSITILMGRVDSHSCARNGYLKSFSPRIIMAATCLPSAKTMKLKSQPSQVLASLLPHLPSWLPLLPFENPNPFVNICVCNSRAYASSIRSVYLFK